MKPTASSKAVIVLCTVASLCSAQQVQIPSGTKVSCRLEQTISSATAEPGQQVQLATTEDVKINDVIVIPQGSIVMGTIVTAQEKRNMGRTGKLDFSIDKVRASDGEFIPLRYTLQKKEGGSHAMSTGVMTAGAAVLFWPAAPFLLLRKGKDITINKGIVLETFTDENHMLKSSHQPASSSSSSGSSASGTDDQATVTITSAVPGAEIEIDGAFIGSTPTTRALHAGTHKIKVTSGSRVWERNLQVERGGTVTVNANFGK